MSNSFFNNDTFSVDAAISAIKQSQANVSKPIVEANSSVNLLTATGQFYVMDIDDKYIARFPKEEIHGDGESQSLNELKAESKITKSISPYIKKTKISNISVVNAQYPFAVHQKIKGHKLTKSDFNNLSDEQKDFYAKDLADFLAELHRVPLDKVDLPDRKDLNFDGSPEVQNTLGRYGLSLYTDVNLTEDSVCCHNDLHAGNVGVDLNKQHILQGIFDFGMCGIANRSSDFYKIFDFDKNLCSKVIEQYNKISPQAVNLHDVENKYLSWCATNIQMAEGNCPQIVSAMEAKLQDFKQWQAIKNKLSHVRSKSNVSQLSSKISLKELRGVSSSFQETSNKPHIAVNTHVLKLTKNKRQYN